ncbi:uncharacterized protein PAC_16851 [Phialocephala subalpina]|uniref:Ubiquitin-like domain-containing protein n=1 Tax=Phialocephala subalpina TaxID=576137 RepID=A0A1L7XPI0_9HELO|nr:uncharacterized protein PAC_16851 [Phialocephala subalpina]
METISDVKLKLKEREEVLYDLYELGFRGQSFRFRNHKFLLDYKIHKGSSITIFSRLYGGGPDPILNVLVRLPLGGEVLAFGVAKKTIYDLKVIIEAQKGIPAQRRIILCRGEILSDFIELNGTISDDVELGIVDLVIKDEEGKANNDQSVDLRKIWRPSVLEQEITYRASEASASAASSSRQSDVVVVSEPKDVNHTDAASQRIATAESARSQGRKSGPEEPCQTTSISSATSPAMLFSERIESDTLEIADTAKMPNVGQSTNDLNDARRRWQR